MHIPLRHQILEQVLELIGLARPLVVSISRRDRELASQIRRALSSVALNVSEGFGSQAGNARLRFESACGSLYEAEAGIRVAIAWGYLSPPNTVQALEALDRLGGRVFGLSRH